MFVKRTLVIISATIIGCATLPAVAKDAIVQKDGSYYAVPYRDYAAGRMKVYRDLTRQAIKHQEQKAKSAKPLVPLTIRIGGGQDQ